MMSIIFSILRLHETGLLAEWEKWYVPSVSKCMKVNERNGNPRLSLKHLSSAFVLLVTGCLVSFVAFVAERTLVKLAILHSAIRVVVV